MPSNDLRQLIAKLRAAGEIVDIERQVDPDLELAEIHRRVIAAKGPALFFHNVKGSRFPVVTNLFGTQKRVELAFGLEAPLLIDRAVQLFHSPPKLKTFWEHRSFLRRLFHLGVKKRPRAAVLEEQIAPVDLMQLPFTKSWPDDGGFFLTLPLVFTQPNPKMPPNLGIYRIQRYDRATTGLHFQIAKGGGYHYHLAEKQNQSLPVSIFLGGPPALTLAAIAPLPENVSELLFTSFFMGKKLQISQIDSFTFINQCEFALTGHARPHQRKLEGPFGDHYGYYSLAHEFPLFECHNIWHRKGAIFPATVVGKPAQEDFFIGNYLQKMMSPLIKLTMPSVVNFWSYGEAGFHTVAAAQVKDRYAREAMTSSFRLLGEGQLALTKCLFVTDQSVNLENFSELLTTVLERFTPQTDCYIFSNLSLDTLDYTGPSLNHGSRMIILGLGEKKRHLPTTFDSTALPFPNQLYCPGTLVIQTPKQFQNFSHLLSHPALAAMPLIVLVDDLRKTVQSQTAFLWTLFTRFNPASDLVARTTAVHYHHLSYELPLLIDARMKPSYPPEVVPDRAISEQVTNRWNHYFSKPVVMGEEFL